MEDGILEEALDLLSDATAQQRSWVLDKLSDVYMGLTLKEDVEEQEEHDAALLLQPGITTTIAGVGHHPCTTALRICEGAPPASS